MCVFLWYQVELLAHVTIKNTGSRKNPKGFLRLQKFRNEIFVKSKNSIPSIPMFLFFSKMNLIK